MRRRWLGGDAPRTMLLPTDWDRRRCHEQAGVWGRCPGKQYAFVLVQLAQQLADLNVLFGVQPLQLGDRSVPLSQ